jgi:hypothetical protein
MRILLDESVPVQIGKALTGHEVFTVRQMGWGGFSNGNLLSAALRENFQVLIIADKNLRYQQNISDLQLTIIELWTNHRPTLENYISRICEAVEAIKSIDYIRLEDPTQQKARH